MVRYQRYADNAVFLASGFSYQTDIVKNKVIALPRIVTVNVGIHILDVDNQSIDNREQRLDVGRWNIKRVFNNEC